MVVRKLGHPAFWWAAVSAVALIVGALGPWATVDLGFVNESVSGTERGGDGTVVIVGAVLVLACLVAWAAFARRNLWGLVVVAAIIGAIMVVLAVVDANSATNGDFLVSSFRDQFKDSIKVGWGLYLVGAAGISLLAASVVLVLTTRRRDYGAARAAAAPFAPQPAEQAPFAVQPAEQAPVAAQPAAAPAQPAASPPAGWFPDPHGAARLRWWDGSRWTEHTH